jgi:NAD(P)H-quinone oxidoreductase subunit 6
VNLAEGVQVVAFGLLTIMMLGTALSVVLLEHIVYSAFLLAGCFVSIATAQVLVYVGAVNVLILFAIMLVNKREDFAPIPGTLVRKAATAVVCGGIFGLLSTMVLKTPWAISTETPIGDGSIVKIGLHFFSDFLLPFEITSVLLLVALIGAIVLARREFIPDIRSAKGEDEALMLPERPRELVSSSKDS